MGEEPISSCSVTIQCLSPGDSCILLGFPGGASGKECVCQCRRQKTHGFDPWAGSIPWRSARQPTPVFLPRESHGQGSLAGYSRKESDVTKATVRACTHKYISHSCPSGFNKARSLSFFVYMFFLRKPTAMQNKTSAHQKFNSEMNFPEG